MSYLCRFLVLLALCGGLSGCAFFAGGESRDDAGGVRPMIAVGGTRIEVADPVENGRALLLTGQYGLAVNALSRVVDDQPQNVRALTLLAEAYGRLRRFDLADRYHSEALALDPNAVVTLNNWGYSYLERGDTARAIGLLERAKAIKGDQPVVQANLQLAIGDTAAAEPAESAEPPAVVEGSRVVSDHVLLLRRTGKLVRLAPGVQLLVTEEESPAAGMLAPAAQQTGAPRAQVVSAVTPPPPFKPVQPEREFVDPRTQVFQALFMLMENPTAWALPDADIYAAALTPGISISYVAP